MPYCGPAPDKADWLFAWNLDPTLLAVLGLVSFAGVIHLRSRSRAQRRAFGIAGAAAIIAFVSPLCAMTVALFSARTAHHLVVIGLLAPALAFALPARIAAATPAFFGLSAALWLWHLPAVYSAAWDSAAVYWVMQAALILPGWLFWSALLHQPALGHVVWLISLVGQMGLLGALLTFAPHSFYVEHLAYAERFGMSALQDQQLAGLVMWVPGMIPLAVLASVMAWRLLHQGVVRT
ncbi:MAG: cytochrome c oxidase assembly protein [Roseinatronobacter sp.]